MYMEGGGEVPGAPGPRRRGGVTVVGGGGKSGGGGATSGSTPGGLVTRFSSSDVRNTGIMVIKSIYNIGG